MSDVTHRGPEKNVEICFGAKFLAHGYPNITHMTEKISATFHALH